MSHAAPRRHFADKQALLDALRRTGSSGWEPSWAALAAAGFDEQLHGMARTYVRFATQHAALLELMYTGKHRPDAAPRLREAADRAFAAPLELFARPRRRRARSRPATPSAWRHVALADPAGARRRWPTAACSATLRSTRSSTTPSSGSCSASCPR